MIIDFSTRTQFGADLLDKLRVEIGLHDSHIYMVSVTQLLIYRKKLFYYACVLLSNILSKRTI